MKILVTGGLGFVGSHLVDELCKDPQNEVYVIDNLCSASSTLDNRNNKATYWIDDIRKLTVTKKYEDEHFDLIFHLAALARIQPSFKDPLEYLSVDVFGTSCVLEYARTRPKGKAKVVYAGSSTAFSDVNLNPYAFAKYTGEQTCKMYSEVFDVSTVVARFFNVYGNRQPASGDYATLIGIFENLTKQNKPLTVTGNGEQRRDFTHVSDIVSGLLALSKGYHTGEVYQLGTGTNYSINEIARMFKGMIVRVPARPGEAKETLADISLMKKCFSWQPKVNLEDYVQNFIQNLQTDEIMHHPV